MQSNCWRVNSIITVNVYCRETESLPLYVTSPLGTKYIPVGQSSPFIAGIASTSPNETLYSLSINSSALDSGNSSFF